MKTSSIPCPSEFECYWRLEEDILLIKLHCNCSILILFPRNKDFIKILCVFLRVQINLHCISKEINKTWKTAKIMFFRCVAIKIAVFKNLQELTREIEWNSFLLY